MGTFSFGFKPLCSQCLAPPDSAQAPAAGGCGLSLLCRLSPWCPPSRPRVALQESSAISLSMLCGRLEFSRHPRQDVGPIEGHCVNNVA